MADLDGELLHRAGTGDGSALGDLVARHLPALRAYVRLNVPPDVRARESCSDLVQSVCLEVLKESRFEYRGPEAFRAWLFRWALHKIRDRGKHWRAGKRTAAREDELGSRAGDLADIYRSIGSPSAAAIAREDAALLERAFDLLADDDREIIALCRIAGLPRTVVAEQVGKTVEAVRMQLSRALVRLGVTLEQLGARPQ